LKRKGADQYPKPKEEERKNQARPRKAPCSHRRKKREGMEWKHRELRRYENSPSSKKGEKELRGGSRDEQRRVFRGERVIARPP